jgi:hypothetical protein
MQKSMSTRSVIYVSRESRTRTMVDREPFMEGGSRGEEWRALTLRASFQVDHHHLLALGHLRVEGEQDAHLGRPLMENGSMEGGSR